MDFADFLNFSTALLITVGFLIGIMGVVVGGGLFFSTPFLQMMYPEASFGQIVGNHKVGGFFRSVGSTISTFRKIRVLENVKILTLLMIGSFIGVQIIADLDQKWILLAVLFAGFLTLYAPKIAERLSHKVFYPACFLAGIYAGFFGAGSGLIMIAIMRLQYPADEEIAHVKIQTRFVQWMTIAVAVAAHYLHGNLLMEIWLPWSIGALAGGVVGGIFLNKMGALSGKTQKGILYVGLVLAVCVSGYRAFEEGF